MKFKKGKSGNPTGRPIGSSKRLTAINIILDIFNDRADNFKSLLELEADRDILKFYEKYIKDLQPKLKVESGKDVLATKAERLDFFNL